MPRLRVVLEADPNKQPPQGVMRNFFKVLLGLAHRANRAMNPSTSSSPSLALPLSATSLQSAGLVASLSKWSILEKELPKIPDVRTVHVYDFDNTLFFSPLPNPKLWSGPSLGQLQNYDTFLNGGWWHDSRILSATGEGVEKEEPRAWGGWWNEHIVSLVQLSMCQKDTLTILLTGRSAKGFQDLIKRIVASRRLGFDMICLKPQVSVFDGDKVESTKHFKKSVLRHILSTYVHTEDFKIYEDRPNHVKVFEDFIVEFNAELVKAGRKPLQAEVVQVAALSHNLDPTIEVAEVQRMIHDHNEELRRTMSGRNFSPLFMRKQVLYTGYLLTLKSSRELLAKYSPPNEEDIRFLASNIMIAPRRAHQSVLHKAGGMGNTVEWEVISTGSWQDRIWAAQVGAVDPNAKVWTENPKPYIVLAHRRNSKPMDANNIRNWAEVAEEHRFRFKATVGEKVVLRIETEEEAQREQTNYYHFNKRRNYGMGGAAGDHRSDRYRDQDRDGGDYNQHYQNGLGGGGGAGDRGGYGGGYRGARHDYDGHNQGHRRSLHVRPRRQHD